MLQKNFYKLLEVHELTTDPAINRKFQIRVEFLPSHPIFLGHFPGNPVVPGVCQIEMVREIVMEILGKPLFLYKSDNIKFLSMINPLVQPVIHIELDLKNSSDNETIVTAVFKSDQLLFLKFRGTLQTELLS